MFLVEFVRNDETQTVGYPMSASAIMAATSIWTDDNVTSLTITDHTDPENPVVIESWTRNG